MTQPDTPPRFLMVFRAADGTVIREHYWNPTTGPQQLNLTHLTNGDCDAVTHTVTIEEIRYTADGSVVRRMGNGKWSGDE